MRTRARGTDAASDHAARHEWDPRHELEATERDVDRAELYTADEVFLCGTGVGIAPVSAVDGLPVGRGGVGATTHLLMQSYFAVVSGHDTRFGDWRTPVYDPGPQTLHA